MKSIKLSQILFCSLSIILLHPSFSASNVRVQHAPNYPIPLTVSPGETTSAYYTITNNTRSKMKNYSVKINKSSAKVVQNLSGSFCPKSINLDPGKSCTLALDITDETNTDFAICSGSSCSTIPIDQKIKVKSSSSSPFAVAIGSYY